MSVTPPIAVQCPSQAVVEGLRTLTGILAVNLDDGRCLQTRQADLLAALADLAHRRAVLDEGCDLVIDPLPAPSGSGLLVLQLRLGASGSEVGTRVTTSAALDGALAATWERVHRFAQRTGDRALLQELLVPHAEHCWPAAVSRAGI